VIGSSARRRASKGLAAVVRFLALGEPRPLVTDFVDQPVLPFAGITFLPDRSIERHVPAETAVHVDHVLLGQGDHLDAASATPSGCARVPSRVSDDVTLPSCFSHSASCGLPGEGEPDDECHSNDGQNDGYERTSVPCRTPIYARVCVPAARR
jgi:hypothetical protein